MIFNLPDPPEPVADSIEGAKIVAAGGWCAQPEYVWDIMRPWTVEDWKRYAREQTALKKKWKKRAKIAEAKLLLGRKR